MTDLPFAGSDAPAPPPKSGWAGFPNLGDSDPATGKPSARRRHDWSRAYGFAVKLLILILRLSLVGFAVMFASALAVGTFWTTYNGLLNFNTAWFVALAFAFGIQGTLWISSWIVAREWSVHKMARRRAAKRLRRDPGRQSPDMEETGRGFWRQHPGKMLMVLIPMAASIFFSFSSLFNIVFKDDIRKVTNISVARSAVASSTGDLDVAIRQQRALDAEALKASPEWKTYQTGLEKLLDVADKSRDLIRNAVQKERQAAEAAAASTRSEIRQRDERIIAIDQRLKVLGTNVQENAAAPTVAADTATMEAELGKQRGELGKLEAQSLELAKDMIDEKVRGRGKRMEGEGPEYRKLAAEKQSVDQQIEVMKRSISSAEGRLKGLAGTRENERREATGRRAAAESDAAKLRSEKTALEGELAGLRVRIADEEAQVQLLGGRLRSVQPPGSVAGVASAGRGAAPAAPAAEPAPDESVAAELSNRMRLAITGFLGTGSRKSYSQMVEGCNKLQDILGRQPLTANAVANVSCDTASFAPAVDRLQESDAARTALAETCKIDDDFNAIGDVARYVNFGRTCMNKTKLPSRLLTGFASRIDDIERVNNKDSSHFDQTLASLQRGDRLAWIALALAVVFDALIFIAALAGAQVINAPSPREGLVNSTQEHDEIMAVGEANFRVFGDEPHKVLMSKLFLAATRPMATKEGRFVSELELDSVPAIHRRGILAMLAAAGENLVHPKGGNRYDVERAFVLDHSAIVARYEREQQWRRGSPRPSDDPGIFPVADDSARQAGAQVQPVGRNFSVVSSALYNAAASATPVPEKAEPASEQGPADVGGTAQADLPGTRTGRSGPKTRWSA